MFTQVRRTGGGGGEFSKYVGGCDARFVKPLPVFKPKYVIFPTQFQTDR